MEMETRNPIELTLKACWNYDRRSWLIDLFIALCGSNTHLTKIEWKREYGYKWGPEEEIKQTVREYLKENTYDWSDHHIKYCSVFIVKGKEIKIEIDNNCEVDTLCILY